MSFFRQLLLERDVVLDDRVVHYDDFPRAVAMWMRVLFGGTSVGGPAGVADSISAVERLQPYDLFQVPQLAFRAADLQALAIAAHGNPGGIIPAVFQPPQPLNNDWDDPLLTYVSHDSAHAKKLLS